MSKEYFREHVKQGLTDFPKHLSSKFIYDKKGDRLFQQIMNMPSYYLTRAEFATLKKHRAAIVEQFSNGTGFDLIELGAGDGKKTKILLRELVSQKQDFSYLPIDISQHVLDELQTALKTELPKVDVHPQQGTYFKTLEQLAQYNDRKKVILMLGSNIGNLLHEEAIDFLRGIQQSMHENDLLFMGFDQKKNPQTILDAYNDETRITEAFNKNILVRINRELGGDFDVDTFLHWPTYNPETGTAKSFLVSTKKQEVHISALDLNVHFEPWETIHTEISQKYTDEVVSWLVDQAGLAIKTTLSDEKGGYKNYFLGVKGK